MCVSPIMLSYTDCGRKLRRVVPCGKCAECVKDKQNEFVIRSIEEQRKRGSMWFVTLTYSKDNVPVVFDEDGEIVEKSLSPFISNPIKYVNRHCPDIPINCPVELFEDNNDLKPNDDFDNVEHTVFGTEIDYFDFNVTVKAINKEKSEIVADVVDKETGEVPHSVYSLNNKDIQKWKKRVRRKIDYKYHRKVDFGYMICGEYGPRTHRPHYHGLLIGLSDADVMLFKKDWETHYGFTCFKKINSFDVERTARYVAKYITKQHCLEDKMVINGFVTKPRKCTSIGYGVPKRESFLALEKDVKGELAGDDPFLKDMNPIKVARGVNYIVKSLKYKVNGKAYKLPRYYRLRLFYVKDAVTGKYRQTALSRMVNAALQRKVETEFVTQCIRMANDLNLSSTYETYAKVSKIVCENEQRVRQDRANTIISKDVSQFRKSRF